MSQTGVYLGIYFICLCFSVNAYVTSSTYKFRQFLDSRLNITKDIQKHIKYDEERLVALKKTTGYEADIEYLNQRLEYFNRLIERTHKNITDEEGIYSIVSHPILTYNTIKNFISNYRIAISNRTIYGERYFGVIDSPEYNTPTLQDLRDAIFNIIRIQIVYNLTAQDIMNGSVKGHNSPILNIADVFIIGVNAFDDGYPSIALQWLEIAYSKLKSDMSNWDIFDWQSALRRLILSHAHIGNSKRTEELLERALELDTSDKYRKIYLQWRNDNLPPLKDHMAKFINFTKLCSQETVVTTQEFYHKCWYRDVLIFSPYYVLKEEVLHYSPYVTLIHNFLSNEDADELIFKAAPLLYGRIEYDEAGNKRRRHRSYGETYDMNDTNEIAKNLSKRLTALTGLNTNLIKSSYGSVKRFPSAEPLKVVNYGTGGFYDVYYDFFTNKRWNKVMLGSGDRLATFFFFLSDVEDGGNLIFPYLKISIKPKKGNAVLWYNYSPNGKMNNRTLKAECPVVIGEKWVARKSIWTWNNDLNRPCGYNKRSTHVAVDRFIRRKKKSSLGF